MTDAEPIVDCHQHFWDLDANGEHYAWINGIEPGTKLAAMKNNYLIANFKTDTEGCNVVKSVHVQGEWRGDPVAETAWLSQLADSNESGFPHAIVGHVELKDENAEQLLDAHCKFARFRGVRQLLNWHPEDASYREADFDYLNDEQWCSRLSLLEKRGLLFEMHMFPWQYEGAAALAKRWPGVTFVVDHVGCPVERDEAGFARWVAGIKSLGELPNVHCKVSGLIHPMHTSKGEWTVASLKPYIEETIKAFTPAKSLFASNFPVDGVCGSYADVVAAVKQVMVEMGLSSQDRALILHDNAVALYKL